MPAEFAPGQFSKVVGLADTGGNRFAYALFDGGEIRVTDFSNPRQPKTQRFPAGSQPYDGLVTPDGRYFLAGLFGEDGVAMLDLWQPEKGAKKILENYGRGQEKLPVFKMPHLRGWSVAQGKAYLPAIGRHEVLVVDVATWKEVGRIPVRGHDRSVRTVGIGGNESVSGAGGGPGTQNETCGGVLLVSSPADDLCLYR